MLATPAYMRYNYNAHQVKHEEASHVHIKLSIFGKLLRDWFLTLLQVHFLSVEAGHASFPMSM